MRNVIRINTFIFFINLHIIFFQLIQYSFGSITLKKFKFFDIRDQLQVARVIST